MVVEKRLPDVYQQHALLDEAAMPFMDVPGRLVVSEYAESPDWWFALRRQDGELVRAVLPTHGRMQPRVGLVEVIRNGVLDMLAA